MWILLKCCTTITIPHFWLHVYINYSNTCFVLVLVDQLFLKQTRKRVSDQSLLMNWWDWWWTHATTFTPSWSWNLFIQLCHRLDFYPTTPFCPHYPLILLSLSHCPSFHYPSSPLSLQSIIPPLSIVPPVLCPPSIVHCLTIPFHYPSIVSIVWYCPYLLLSYYFIVASSPQLEIKWSSLSHSCGCMSNLLWAYALTSGCVFSIFCRLYALTLFWLCIQHPLYQIGHWVVCRGTGHVLSLRPSPILHPSYPVLNKLIKRKLIKRGDKHPRWYPDVSESLLIMCCMI